MEKSAANIGRAKFCAQTPARQHKLLATLALEFGDDLSGFETRYAEMHRWVDLDRYTPPDWLTPHEAMVEYERFHRQLEGKTSAQLLDDDRPISWQPRFDVTVVLDQVRTPYNAGSILRLIDNYGLRRMVHATSHFNEKHPRLQRAARGAEQWIPIEKVDDLPAWLKAQSLPIIGLEADKRAVALQDWAPPKACVVIVGNEHYGIAQNIRDLCDTLVAIPTFGYKNSMNLTHAFAVTAQKIVEKAERIL